MGEHPPVGAAAEWRRYWPLPIVAALGMASSGLTTHAIGPLMVPLAKEFGWTRTEISSGLTVCSLGSVLFLSLIGMLVDRWGARRVGLAGVLLMPAAFALLGTATGSLGNWLILWCGMAFGALWVSGATWTTAIAGRFDAGRGMAVAVTISGGALSLVIFPPLLTILMQSFGWRKACFITAAIVATILFLLVFFFFRDARDDLPPAKGAQAAPPLTGVTLQEALRMRALYALLLAGGAFTFSLVGTMIHLVPMMISFGDTPVTAAWIASVAGFASIAGRLGTGALLDRFPGYLVGAVAYLLPIVACLLLLIAGTDLRAQVAAAIIFGLSMGAELDVVSYLTTRYFGMKHIGTLLGVVMSTTSAGLATGPLVAGIIFDRFDGYGPFMIITIGLMLVSGAALLSLRRVPVFAGSH
jgi:MFS family permease